MCFITYMYRFIHSYNLIHYLFLFVQPRKEFLLTGIVKLSLQVDSLNYPPLKANRHDIVLNF